MAPRSDLGWRAGLGDHAAGRTVQQPSGLGPPRDLVASLVNQDAVAVNQKLDILFVLENLVQLFPLVFEMLKVPIISGTLCPLRVNSELLGLIPSFGNREDPCCLCWISHTR